MNENLAFKEAWAIAVKAAFIFWMLCFLEEVTSIAHSQKIIAANYQSPEHRWAQAVMRGKECPK